MDVSVVPNITGKVSRTPLNNDDVGFLNSEGRESKLTDTLPIESQHSQLKCLLETIIISIVLLPRKSIPIKVRMDIGRVISK